MKARHNAHIGGKLRLRLLGISPDESNFTRRGFSSTNPAIRTHLETIGSTFIKGYRAALLLDDQELLRTELEQVEPELLGFAYEGAAMGLALSDFFTPWENRWKAFVQGPGQAHVYMMHVGLGWAWARLPVSLTRRLNRLDPLLRWLALDGYGFHQGYFHWPKFIEGQKLPRLSGYAARAFDQGLGRSLWFVRGADVERIAAAVAVFSPERHADLWSGVGLACAYAGGVAKEDVERLRRYAGALLPQLSQGMAFAAKARQRADNMVAHTEMACLALCSLPAGHAAALTDEALIALPQDGGTPAYEIWRGRIQHRLSGRQLHG